MWLKKYWLLIFISQLAFAQSPKLSLENKIYDAVDAFVAKPNEESLQQLEATERNFHPKSKAETLAFVILKCNKAYYENQFGLTNDAISSYEKAWQLFQKNQLVNYDIVESCLQPLGNLYTIIGDYDNAENTIKHYYYIATVEKNQQQKYAAVLNLSNVFQNTGRIKEAIDLLEKTIQTETLSSTQKGNLLNNLGNANFLNANYSKAESTFLSSVNLLKGDVSQSKNLSNAYRNLSSIYSQQQQFDLANSYMNKAIKAFLVTQNGTPREQAKLYFENANLHFKQAEVELAEANLKAVFKILIPNYSKSKTILPNENSLYAETVLMDALDLQAEIFLAKKQPKKALEAYQLSFHIEELLQSLLVYENSKIVSQIRNRKRTEKCLNIYYSLYQKEKNTSYIESAFLLSEATKSAVLRAHLSNSKTRSREEKLIMAQLQNWNTIIIKEQQKLDLADISKINQAIQKQNALMLLLKTKTTKKGNESEKGFAIKDLYSKLEKDKALMVEYFFGYNKMYLFTIDDKKLKIDFFRTDHTAVPSIVSFLDYFNNSQNIINDVSNYNHYGFLLYELLKLPKKSNNKNLIIVPDGVLTFLPFEALITQESTTTNFAKMHYLLNDFKVGYSNSASFYMDSKPFQHKKENVLGVFPIFENSPLALPFSKKEMESIKINFSGTYLEKSKATFENFKTNASNFSILHLSTHATSGDIYSPASMKFYDQEILYSELYNLNMNPDLVVLSACETGLGKFYKAEGAMSIARGFQFAGAQNLLFSLWKVNDYTTSVFMKYFYENVKNNPSYFEANHQAKLDYLNDTTIPNAKKSPYYWSAMVYYGSLESKSTTSYFLYILLLFVTSIGLFLFYKKVIHGRSPKHSKKE